MLKLSYDLHIHSCLSPCGDEDMTPANIVNMASLKQLDIIAVTDHNSCKNCEPVLKLAAAMNILAIPGMELCTMEEVHVLCLFADLDEAMRFDSYVYDKMIKIPNNADIFGRQQIVNEDDKPLGEEPNLLINATNIAFEDMDNIMSDFRGVYIPAHIDKSSNSVIANLGFIPPGLGFKSVELSDVNRLPELSQYNPCLKECNIINNSDAHVLWLINEPINYIEVSQRSVDAVLKVLGLKD